jgi:hypothetical protein
MHKTRVIGGDFGTHSMGTVLPYSSYTVASRVNHLTAAIYNAYHADTFTDLVLNAYEGGHYYYGLNKTYDCALYMGGDSIGTEEFISTEFKRPQFNGCTHRKSTGICKTFSGAAYSRTLLPGPYSDIWFPARYYYVPTSGSAQTPLDKHTPVDWSDAQRYAWHEMQPRFEGDISMFNFLLELRDFRQLAKLLRQKPLRKLRNYFRRLRKSLDPSRPLAEAHLMNEFALKPLLADIVKITCQLEEIVQNVQDEFAEAGQGRNSRHWSETRVIDDADLTYGGYGYYYRAIGDAEVQKFTATMEYSYKYSARSSIDAFMRYWGLIPTTEAVWNAIPFSFVVDYFVKVGNSIAAMEKDPNVDVLMTQYCESILSKRTSGIHLLLDKYHEGILVIDGNLTSDQINLVSGYESSLYTRRVCRPNKGAVLPRVSPMSSRQGLNLAALLRCFF